LFCTLGFQLGVLQPFFMKKFKWTTLVSVLIVLVGCATGPSQEEYDNMQKELEDARHNVDSWEAHAKDFERQRDEAVTERDQLSAENVALQEQNERLIAERDALQAEKEQLIAERDGLQKEKEQLIAERDGLQKEKDDLQKQIEQLRRELANAKALIDNQEKLINDPKYIQTLTQQAKLEAENEDLRNKVKSLEDERTALQERLAAVQDSLKTVEGNLATSEINIANLQKSLNEALAEISRLQDIIVDQTNEIKDIRYRLNVREQDLERYLQSQQ
jgi:chromosome segregation ATPase